MRRLIRRMKGNFEKYQELLIHHFSEITTGVHQDVDLLGLDAINVEGCDKFIVVFVPIYDSHIVSGFNVVAFVQNNSFEDVLSIVDNQCIFQFPPSMEFRKSSLFNCEPGKMDLKIRIDLQ